MSTSKRGKEEKRLRVRTKRLKEIDSTKLSLALWLVAKNIVEKADETDSAKDCSPAPQEEKA